MSVMSVLTEPTLTWRRDLARMSGGPVKPEGDEELEGEFEDEDWDEDDLDEFDEDDLEDEEIEDWGDDDEDDDDED